MGKMKTQAYGWVLIIKGPANMFKIKVMLKSSYKCQKSYKYTRKILKKGPQNDPPVPPSPSARSVWGTGTHLKT